MMMTSVPRTTTMMMSSRRSKSLNLRKRGNANKAVQQEFCTYKHSTAQYVSIQKWREWMYMPYSHKQRKRGKEYSSDRPGRYHMTESLDCKWRRSSILDPKRIAADCFVIKRCPVLLFTTLLTHWAKLEQIALKIPPRPWSRVQCN